MRTTKKVKLWPIFRIFIPYFRVNVPVSNFLFDLTYLIKRDYRKLAPHLLHHFFLNFLLWRLIFKETWLLHWHANALIWVFVWSQPLMINLVLLIIYLPAPKGSLNRDWIPVNERIIVRAWIAKVRIVKNVSFRTKFVKKRLLLAINLMGHWPYYLIL